MINALKHKKNNGVLGRKVLKSSESLENKTILARHDLHGYYYEGNYMF